MGKLTVHSNNNCHYTRLESGSSMAEGIARDLGILLDDYIEILRDNNGFASRGSIEGESHPCYFHTLHEARKAIEDLESYHHNGVIKKMKEKFRKQLHFRMINIVV